MSDIPEAIKPSLENGLLLWRATNAWQRAMRAALAPAGLTYVQVLLLWGLSELLSMAKEVSQAALAENLGADKMMTSQVLRTLEADGLVERYASSRDTRLRLLNLTPLGRDKLRQALPSLVGAEDAFFRTLGRKQDRLFKSLKKLAAGP